MKNNPLISIIACIGKSDRGLGKDNDLLWKISDDLKRFKEITSGHPIIMGRKTFDSIGKPLPNRTSIVITKDSKIKFPDGVIKVNSLEEAIEKANEIEDDEIFIIGGGQIYNQAIDLAERLYLTIVDAKKEADTFFPEYENKFKKIISKKEISEANLAYSYIILEK